jgi:ribosomal RNA-processing protein 8
MFAVPGWSLPSEALRTQLSGLSNSSINPTTNPSLTSTRPGSEVASKAGKKRKRANGVSKTPEVNSVNLSELWQTVIEKKSNPEKLSKKKKHTKKRSKDWGKLDDRSPVLKGKTGEKGNFDVKEKYGRLKGGERASKAPLVSSNLASNGATESETPSVVESVPNLTPLQQSMRQKLISARFRHLNQTLYTNPSARSLALFQENPEMFQEYHEGFRRQVEVWPENPLDGYLAKIRRRGVERIGARTQNKSTTNGEDGKQSTEALPLPRTDGICYIADLGCGDAGLSKGLEGIKKELRLRVFSYDLQSPSPLVTQADIADLPLKDSSIDVAIFCLALMGTNWIDFIEEAFRILRWKGELWIAEIKSRFGRVPSQARRVDHSVGNRKRSGDLKAKKIETDAEHADILVEVDGHEDNKGETDVSAFVEVLRKRGFILQDDKAVDLSNKMFVRMNFVKGLTPIKGKCVPVPKGMVDTWKKKPKGKFLDEDGTLLSSEATVLKPCVYKLR